MAGVVLSVVGFYVRNAASYPAVQAIIAPSYAQSVAGIERIRREGSITSAAPEFPALAEVVEERIASQNPAVPRAAITLDRLEAGGGGLVFGRASSRQIVNLKMLFRGQQKPVEWDLFQLEAAVEARWAQRSLTWAVWLFWLGVVQTIWPNLVPSRGTKTGPMSPPDATIG